MGLSGTEVITTGSSVMSSVLVSEMRLMTYSDFKETNFLTFASIRFLFMYLFYSGAV